MPGAVLRAQAPDGRVPGLVSQDLIGILMTQCAAYPPLSPVYLDFWTSVYQAIDD